jgi:hypothetical protein
MKQALEALESCTPADTSTGHVVWPSYDEQAVAQAITALRTAIAEAEKQEPVAWRACGVFFRLRDLIPEHLLHDATPLYTTPPAAQRQWVGLTDEEIHDCFQQRSKDKAKERQLIAQAIAAKLKEKNT